MCVPVCIHLYANVCGYYIYILKFNAEFVHNRPKFNFLARLLIVLYWHKSSYSYCKLLPGMKYLLFPFLDTAN